MASFRQIAFEFDANARPLMQILRDLERQVRRVPRGKTVHIKAKLEQAKREINALEDQLEELDAEHHDIEVTADIKRLVAKLATARQIIGTLPEKKTVTVEFQEKVSKDVRRVGSVIADVTRGVGRLRQIADTQHALKNALAPSVQLQQSLSRLSVILRRIPPLMAGIVMVLTAALVPAILAATAAIGGLVVAIGSLATALVAALGPAVMLLVGLFNRFSKIMEARKSREQAIQQQQRAGLRLAGATADAEERRHDAARAVRDAVQGVTRAERALAQARKQAVADIQAARQREADALRRVQDAQEDLREATVDAYREMEDAIEAASDAVLSLERAKLDAARADLNLREAKNELAEFRKQLGLTGDEFNNLFTKFTDVNVKFDKRALGNLLAQQGGVSASDQLELERLILNVRDAQLGVKEATDQVSDSERELSRANQEANRFRREGIAASDGYRSAIQALADAQRDATEASREARELERQGVANAPGVIAAQESLRDAREAHSEALRNQRRALTGAAAGASALATALQDHHEDLKELTPAEQAFLDIIDGVGKAWRNFITPGTDQVILGLRDAVNQVIPRMGILRGAMQDLGATWGEQIRLFAQNATSPASMLNLTGFVAAANQLSSIAGRIARDLFNAFSNIASAAMPFLIAEAERFSRAVSGWAKGTQNIEGMQAVMGPAVELLRTVLDGIVQFGRGMVNVFTAAEGPINDFADWIRDGLRGFADWAKSDEGREQIREFFEDTLPYVKSFVRFLLTFGRVLLKSFQIVLPILRPIIDLFNFVGEAFLLLLRAIDWLIGPFKTLIGYFAALMIGVGPVSKIIAGLINILRSFGFFIAAIILDLGGFALRLAGPFINAFRRIKAVFSGIPIKAAARALVSALGAIWSRISSVLMVPVRLAWRLVRGAFKAAYVVLSVLLGGFVSGLLRVWEGIKKIVGIAKRVFGGVKGAIRGALSGLAAFVSGVFDKVVNAVKGGINLLIDAVNWLIDKINKIPNVKVFGREVGIPDIPKIPKLKMATGGIVTRATSAIVGEAGPEAVIPLSGAVMSRLAAAIVSAMQIHMPAVSPRLAPAGGGGGTTIQHMEVNFTSPSGGPVDPRYASVQLARELERRR